MDSDDKDDYGDLDGRIEGRGVVSKAVIPPPVSSFSSRSGSPSKSAEESRSQRSTSAAKTIADMYLLPRPTVLKSFYDRKMSLPEGLSEMLSTVAKYARGFHVIAESRKASLSSLICRRSQL